MLKSLIVHVLVWTITIFITLIKLFALLGTILFVVVYAPFILLRETIEENYKVVNSKLFRKDNE